MQRLLFEEIDAVIWVQILDDTEFLANTLGKVFQLWVEIWAYFILVMVTGQAQGKLQIQTC